MRFTFCILSIYIYCDRWGRQATSQSWRSRACYVHEDELGAKLNIVSRCIISYFIYAKFLVKQPDFVFCEVFFFFFFVSFF